MEKIIYFYQHLPQKIDPTIFSWSFFQLDWYSLMYIVGFLTVYLLLKYRIKRQECVFSFDVSQLENFLLGAFLGLILGARIGYVLFYNLPYYVENPLAIISPFDLQTGEFLGIYGMSYHGGFLDVLFFVWLFSRKNKVDFMKLVNFVVPAIPLGYFFGRIGNFLNGELYGRATEKIWGMYFPADIFGTLRHPSQLYEAFFEGIILFLILWKFRNSGKMRNKLFAIYILGYAFFRFGIEFFREPDLQIGYILGFLTLGQILSLVMIILGIFLFFWCSEKIEKVV